MTKNNILQILEFFRILFLVILKMKMTTDSVEFL